ncbi:hypothetical protein R6Z07F_009501 [Ovis aries]
MANSNEEAIAKRCVHLRPDALADPALVSLHLLPCEVRVNPPTSVGRFFCPAIHPPVSRRIGSVVSGPAVYVARSRIPASSSFLCHPGDRSDSRLFNSSRAEGGVPPPHPRLAADPFLRRGERGLGSERGQEAAPRYPAPGCAVPGRLPQGRSEPRGSTVTARGREAGSLLSPHPRSAAIQTPPGPSPPRTSPGRELQGDSAQFPRAPGLALEPRQLRRLRAGREAEGPGAEGTVGASPRSAASSFHRRAVVQRPEELEPRAPRKTSRAYKQSHVASGLGGPG